MQKRRIGHPAGTAAASAALDADAESGIPRGGRLLRRKYDPVGAAEDESDSSRVRPLPGCVPARPAVRRKTPYRTDAGNLCRRERQTGSR
jgi:hypothetical protein